MEEPCSDKKKVSYSATGNNPDAISELAEKAASFIIPFEGFKSTPYLDVRQWSIGYGTGVGYDLKVKPNISVTKEQAKGLLINWLKTDIDNILTATKKPLTQNQMIALLSFAYNLGTSRATLMVSRLNDGQTPEQIATTMRKYWHAAITDPVQRAKVEEHLKTRRNKEANLFLS